MSELRPALTLNIYINEEGTPIFEGDETILQKVEGQNLTNVDISQFRVTAEDLARAFEEAEKYQTDGSAKVYKKLKQAFIAIKS